MSSRAKPMIDVFRHFCRVTPATKEAVAAEAASQGFEAFELNVPTRRDPALEVLDTAFFRKGDLMMQFHWNIGHEAGRSYSLFSNSITDKACSIPFAGVVREVSQWLGMEPIRRTRISAQFWMIQSPAGLKAISDREAAAWHQSPVDALVHIGVIFTDKRVDLSRMYQTVM